MASRTRAPGRRALIALTLIVLGLVLGLPGLRASAHPLFRIHVRPSAYRLAPPRLSRLPSLVRRVAGVVPQAVALGPHAAALASTAALARSLMGRR